MGITIDLLGQRFGRLVVIEKDTSIKRAGNKTYWKCQCDCGNQKSVVGQSLREGKTTSCGCLMKEKVSANSLKDLSGQRFGKLIVVQRVGSSKNKHATWLCQCDCGKTTIVDSSSLISGNTKSCGCIISNGENIIANILDSMKIEYKQQYTFPDLTGDDGYSRLRFDFAIFDNNQKLLCLIEFQGEQHFFPRKEDTLETFNKRLRYDKKKKDYCKEHNIELIEIPYQDRMILDATYLSQFLYKKQ